MLFDIEIVWILLSMVLQILANESFPNPLNSVHVLKGFVCFFDDDLILLRRSISSTENLDRVHCVVEVEDLTKNTNTKRRIVSVKINRVCV